MGLVMMVQKGGPRRNASLAEQSRSQKVWFAMENSKSSKALRLMAKMY